MPVSDTIGQAGTIVPQTQQIQHPATSMQLTDIITHAPPPQTQPATILHHSIIPQQQKRMNPQTSTLQQQPQQQMEAQVTFVEQQVGAIQLPPGQDQQSLSVAAIQKHQLEPMQQTCVRQPVQHVQPAPQQHVMTTQTGVTVPQQPTEQPQALTQQLYVQQQREQQQQTVLVQQQEQHAQLQQQQPPQYKQLMDQQQPGSQQQEQSVHAYVQHTIEQRQLQPLPLQQQQQSKSHQQTGQHQSRTKTEADMQWQIGEQQQQTNVLHLQLQQTHQSNDLQQQNTTQQMEQQLLIQDLQKQLILTQKQLQQKAQLQQQEQHQVQLKQHMEQQQKVLLQLQLEQQHQQLLLQQRQADLLHQQVQMKHQLKEQQQQQAVIIQPQTEKHEPGHVPQSDREPQIQQQANLQQLGNPQLNISQFTQQQQPVVAQHHHHSSTFEPHLSVGVPGGTETIQHQTYITPPTQVPMTIQTTQAQVHPQKQEQFPVQLLPQSISQASQLSPETSVTSPAAMIPGQMQQMQVYQTKQVQLQANYPGPVTPTQGQVAVLPLIQTHPLHATAVLQAQQIPGQVPKVDVQMIGQQNQSTAQSSAAVTSGFSPIHQETCVQQNTQIPNVIQSNLLQEVQGQPPYQVHPQSTAGFLTPHYVLQPTHQSIPPLLHDMPHISQQQVHQEQALQYQQIVPSPGLAGSVETKTGGLAVDPTRLLTTSHPVQVGQGDVLSQTSPQIVQAQQQSARSSVDSSIIQPVSRSLMSQSVEHYQQQLQSLSQVHQPPAQPSAHPQLLAQPIQIPTPQPSPVKQDLVPLANEGQLPPQCPSTSHAVIQPSALMGAINVSEAQSQSSTLPLYGHLLVGGPPSPQTQANQMLPAHTHTQTSNQAQTHSQTQTQVHPQAHSQTQTHNESSVPAQQIPHGNTSCPSAPPPSLPPQQPSPAPATELSTSPPVTQVALKRQAEFIPTTPSPITALQTLDSNVLKMPQALLQDCDISLQGVPQVHRIQMFALLITFLMY